MVEKFTLSFRNRTEDVKIECKECSKDGLKYICTLADAEPFRIRLNDDGVWVAKHENCQIDPQLIRAIGERYEEIQT
jgi:hypothetical protein